MTVGTAFPNTSAPFVDQNGSLAPIWRRLLLFLWSNNSMPGDIKMIGGLSTPTNWLVCDGTAISRTLYADLYAAIGTSWGVGNGMTTFNLPNLQGSAPLTAGGKFIIRY